MPDRAGISNDGDGAVAVAVAAVDKRLGFPRESGRGRKDRIVGATPKRGREDGDGGKRRRRTGCVRYGGLPLSLSPFLCAVRNLICVMYTIHACIGRR